MKLTDYSHHPQKQAIRDGFGRAMLELGRDEERVVALCADLTESLRLTEFQKKYSHRFIQVGVAEQNMMGLATGLALEKKIPFAASFAVFNPGRNWDQLRVGVCYSNLNVKVIGGHAGLTVGKDGATHQAMEDIAITRVLPNMTVVVPCDYEQARLATHHIAKHNGPVYLRLSRYSPVTITSPQTPFKIGKAQVLREGTDITIIATGIMVSQAMLAADTLAKQNISAEVINLHTIKPIDTKTIINSAKKTGRIITVEEHQITGGMGSAVAEVLSENFPTKIKRIGMNDSFGESGKADDLLEKYSLTDQNVVKEAVNFIKN